MEDIFLLDKKTEKKNEKIKRLKKFKDLLIKKTEDNNRKPQI